MEFSISSALEILNSTPAVLEKQLAGLSSEWLMSNEGKGTWTPAEVVCHLIHCEEDDWVARMNLILSDTDNKAFRPFDRSEGFNKSMTKTISELLDEFRVLREKNVAYLISLNLTDTDLNKKGIHPAFGEVTLKQLLSAWTVHDLSHISQICRIIANQYAEQVGPWTKYLPFLKKKFISEIKTAEDERVHDWSSYYKNKSNLVPRDTLLKALEIFEKEKPSDEQLFAIDLGCGHGADTLELLKRNWKVLAIDNSDEGLAILEDSIIPSRKCNFRKVNMSFEDLKLMKCNLLNASYSLPFCKPEFFSRMMKEIDSSILKGGRFSGNFFGKNDSWSGNKNMTFHTKEELLNYFRNFEMEYLEEKDEDGVTASGESKHWHVYSVIAKKISDK
ncbi:MAG TPA: DinB family protein [Ignavibacteria bacterium]|nr:DinB family protein [Ignavibacteria bacterium]